MRTDEAFVKLTIALGVVIGYAVPLAFVVTMIDVRGKILPTVILEVHLRKTALGIGFHGSVAGTLHAECRVLVDLQIWQGVSLMTYASMLTILSHISSVQHSSIGDLALPKLLILYQRVILQTSGFRVQDLQ
jgi:hypothetical protein